MEHFNIWPILISSAATAAVTIVISYVSFINTLRIEVALLKQRAERNEQRLNRKSQQMDELIKNVTSSVHEVKEYVQQELGEIKGDFGEIKGDLKILTQLVKGMSN